MRQIIYQVDKINISHLKVDDTILTTLELIRPELKENVEIHIHNVISKPEIENHGWVKEV